MRRSDGGNHPTRNSVSDGGGGAVGSGTGRESDTRLPPLLLEDHPFPRTTLLNTAVTTLSKETRLQGGMSLLDYRQVVRQ